MLFKNITILDEDLNVQSGMNVGVEKERIEYIGKDLPEKDYGEVYKGEGKLLMPAFYNAHAHCPMTLMRGFGENMALSEWLNDRIFPFEDHLYSEGVYYAALLSMAESIRFGIVSSSDMYFFSSDIADAVIDSGAKANIARCISSFEEGSIKNGNRYREAVEFVNKYHKAAGGRIIVDASIHGEYTNTLISMREVAEYAAEYGLNMNVHISETRDEHEGCKARYGGRTPVKLMDELGVFNTRSTAAHCVWVEEEDLDILAARDVTVACCPVSNLKLASGICNVPELFSRNIRVAIGTDSAASNNSMNFIEEMKFFALLSKYRNSDPTVITPEQTIRAATSAGAYSQGREDCGSLRTGNRADLIVIDIEQPYMKPVYDLATNLVYSASGSDVVLTMCDGKVLYRDGEYKTIDIEKAMAETERACGRILSALK